MARIAGWNRRSVPPKRRQVRDLLRTANKKILGAIGVGLLAIISAAVVAVPHWLASTIDGPAPQLTAAYSASPNLLTSDECALGGKYFVTSGPAGIGPFSDQTIGPWLVAHSARPADETTAEFTLQGAPNGSTVVITGVHTVLLSRVAAPAGTQLVLNSDNCGAGPAQYGLLINLDARNPTPNVVALNESDQPTAHLPSLQITVDNANPAMINIDATTSQHDVQWKLRVDYTVNGQVGHLFVPTGNDSYHTTAVTGDPVVTLNHNVLAAPADKWSDH